MESTMQLESFMAELDTITCDSLTSESSQLLKYKNENKKLVSLLKMTKSSTTEMLSLYKSIREVNEVLQQELRKAENARDEYRKQFDEMVDDNVNKVFKLTEELNYVKEKRAQDTADYVELSEEFLTVLSDASCFYNYEMKKSQLKVMSKTELFLLKQTAGAYKKPKIIRSKRMMDLDSVISKTSSRASTRASSRLSKREPESPKPANVKRRKTDIWDMKSISQASSPAATTPFLDEETSDLISEICEADSGFSFNTFSMSNETSFSLLQSRRSSPEKPRDAKMCKCHLPPENLPPLVSVGTNTETPETPTPSLPNLSLNEFDTSITSFGNFSDLEEVATIDKELLSGLKETKHEEPDSSNDVLVSKVSSKSIATNTDEECLPVPSKKTVEQGTSPEPVLTSNKGTATVHSTTTRGTSTVTVKTRSLGIQFPEFSVEQIFEEMLFDLPDPLPPMIDLLDIDELESCTHEMETMTDLCNVNREIDYVGSRNEFLSPTKKTVSESKESDETSFILLGQTLFDLFMKRIEKFNNPLNDDEITRKKIWKHIKRELVDRFSELTFDEMLNSSLSSEFDTQERISDTCKEVNDDCMVEDRIEIIECKPKERELNAILGKETEDKRNQEEVEKKMFDTSKEVTDDCMGEDRIEIIEIIECKPKEKELNAILGKETEDERNQEEAESEIIQDQVMPPPVILTSECIPEEAIEDQENTQNQCEIPATLNDQFEHVDESVDFETAFRSLQSSMNLPVCPCIEPIEDLTDVIWNSLFNEPEEVFPSEDCPMIADDVLDGFDLEHEPVEIPFDVEVEEIIQSKEIHFNENETPRSPPPFIRCTRSSSRHTKIIPMESSYKPKKLVDTGDSVLEFNPNMRMNLLQWQQRQTITSQPIEKRLCVIRKSIAEYLNSDWSDENLEKCLLNIKSSPQFLLIAAIYETVEDNSDQDEINTEFTPPAPPLPHYQQKLILLIKKLTEINPQLPHKLIVHLEEKIFRLENFSAPIADLRNVSYFYSGLVDLFLDGDSTVVFYFIVKCIYFFGYKSIPMAFVLLKAFPSTLPKKSSLMKKYNKDIDYENMTGLQLSKIQMNVEWIDSLELTVMHLLTCIQQFRKKGHESNAMKDHELFSFLPRFYGFQLSFITAQKLFDVLVGRLESGRTDNLALSLVLLARRANPDFTLKTMLKGKLVPLLRGCVGVEHLEEEPKKTVRILLETISSILKPFTDEKEKSFKEVFPLIVSILSHTDDQKIQESCVAAILRLQRFIDNQREIFKIIQHHQQNSSARMNENLCHAIQTFIHRKKANFFKDST